MNAQSKTIRGRFLSTLESFSEEGYLYTTFRTSDGGIANIPLKGFRTKNEADEYVKSQFEPDEVPTIIELISNVIRDILDGHIRNWKDFIEIQLYFKEKLALNKSNNSEDLISKRRKQGEDRNRGLK